MITKEEAKLRYIELLNKTGESRVGELINLLEKVHFFNAPATVNSHDNFAGGLCLYSLKVFEVFNDKAIQYALNISLNNIIIVSLLHGLGKARLYKIKENMPISEKQIGYVDSLAKKANFPITKEELSKYTAVDASALIEWLKGSMVGNRPEIGKIEWDFDSTQDTKPQWLNAVKNYYKYIDKFSPMVELLLTYQDGIYDTGRLTDFKQRLEFQNAKEMCPEWFFFASAKEEASKAKQYKRLDGTLSDLW